MQRLVFPEHLYVVDGGNLAAYSPSAGKLAEFMPLPNVNPANGVAHAAVEAVHSVLQPAWLVFFRVLSSSGEMLTAPSLMQRFDHLSSVPHWHQIYMIFTPLLWSGLHEKASEDDGVPAAFVFAPIPLHGCTLRPCRRLLQGMRLRVHQGQIGSSRSSLRGMSETRIQLRFGSFQVGPPSELP